MSRVEIEERMFIIDMKDRWSHEDYAAYDKYAEMLKDLKKEGK